MQIKINTKNKRNLFTKRNLSTFMFTQCAFSNRVFLEMPKIKFSLLRYILQ